MAKDVGVDNRPRTRVSPVTLTKEVTMHKGMSKDNWKEHHSHPKGQIKLGVSNYTENTGHTRASFVTLTEDATMHKSMSND